MESNEIIWLSVGVTLFTVLLILGIIFRRKLYIAYKTFPRDSTASVRFARLFIRLKWQMVTNATIGSLFDGVAQRNPNHVCFYFEDEIWTFKQVQELTNKISNYFLQLGYKKGDCVALFMENRVEYVCIWLGLSKIGVVTALINYNLRQQSLQHCVDVAKAKCLIFGTELTSAVQDVFEGEGFKSLTLFSFGKSPENSVQFEDFLQGVKKLNEEIIPASIKNPVVNERIGVNDHLCYVYTSGTTGLPKAAVIKHSRAMLAANGVQAMNGIRNSDILYTPLPLYHIQAGIVAVGQALMTGVPVVIVKKFSASRFWKDCIRYNVTVVQYMGEICRYLLNQPVKPEDKQHKVRRMFGNGIRREIWQEFLDRFNNPVISEMYGATEGNCNLVNIDGHVGAIGFLPRIAIPLFPQKLVKVDEVTGEILRNPRTNYAIKCGKNEPGEMIGKIVANNPVREFQGYTDATSSKKKIITDVFSKGDSYFRSGDILVYDEFGYFYFKDRAGDTFRWKAENVSTAEVEGIAGKYCGLKDAVVFGVEIPNCEGRAGMLAIADPDDSINLEKLGEGIMKELPHYARPIFIRIGKHISSTGTYKLQKFDLQKEGYDPSKIPDSIYFLSNGKYIPLDSELHQNIISGKIRL